MDTGCAVSDLVLTHEEVIGVRAFAADFEQFFKVVELAYKMREGRKCEKGEAKGRGVRLTEWRSYRECHHISLK